MSIARTMAIPALAPTALAVISPAQGQGRATKHLWVELSFTSCADRVLSSGCIRARHGAHLLHPRRRPRHLSSKPNQAGCHINMQVSKEREDCQVITLQHSMSCGVPLNTSPPAAEEAPDAAAEPPLPPPWEPP